MSCFHIQIYGSLRPFTQCYFDTVPGQVYTLRLQVVFPGQVLCKLPEAGQLRVGPGLQPHAGSVCTIKSGILRKTKTGKLWVEGRQKR